MRFQPVSHELFAQQTFLQPVALVEQQAVPHVLGAADLHPNDMADRPGIRIGHDRAPFGMQHLDLDRGRLRIPETRWREGNLSRLKRSMLKLRGSRSEAEVEQDFARLRRSYDALWSRGT